MIAREFTGRGWTAEQYDTLIERMELALEMPEISEFAVHATLS